MISDPEITFSEWTPWADRPRLKRADGPWLAVYMWARFERTPGQGECPYPALPKQVIYVGETKHVDLRPLIGDHHRLGHYRESFPDDTGLKKLYVSISRVARFPGGYGLRRAREKYRRLRVYTQFIEAKIYWDYTRQWNRPPALHYKKSRKASDY